MKRDEVEGIAAEMRAKLAQDNRLGVLLGNADAQIVVRALEEMARTMPAWEVGDKESVTVVAQTTASGSVVATAVVQS